VQNGELNLTNARGFFQNSQMPNDFFRRNGSFGLEEIGPDISAIFTPHPISPGFNQGVGNYVIDPASANFTTVSLHNNVTLILIHLSLCSFANSTPTL
jgi:unspecific peroxygenase